MIKWKNQLPGNPNLDIFASLVRMNNNIHIPYRIAESYSGADKPMRVGDFIFQ